MAYGSRVERRAERVLDQAANLREQLARVLPLHAAAALMARLFAWRRAPAEFAGELAELPEEVQSMIAGLAAIALAEILAAPYAAAGKSTGSSSLKGGE